MSRERPFVAREGDLSLLRACLNGVVAGRPLALLLEGEPGAGKSALLARFAAELRRSGPRRLRVLSAASPDAAEFDPLAEAIRSGRRRKSSGAKASRARELTRRLVPEWLGAIPVWGEVMGAIAETMDVAARHRSPPPGFEDDEALAALVSATGARPLALLVDDGELASPAGVSRLARLVKRAPQGTRLLIVVAYSPPAPGAGPGPVHRLRAELRGERSLHRQLLPFSAAELADWAHATFAGADIPGETLERLRELTDGRPGELARLVETGALAPEAGVLVLDERTALGAIGADLTSALERLGPEIAEVVRHAGTLGERFEAAELARRLARDEVELEDGLSLAAHYGVLVVEGEVEGPDGFPTTVYRFRSRRLRARLAGESA